MNKTAFVISVVLTTFVLMSIAGIVYTLRAPQPATDVQAAPETSIEAQPAEAVPTVDPSLEQILLERESVYQQRIAEANARLLQAQQQLAAQSQLVNQPAVNQNTVTAISSDQAMQIAANFLGTDSVYWVEKVTVNGEEMYLVTFASGDVVYVNYAGQVVGSAPAQGFGSSNGGGGGGKKTISTGGDDHGQSEHESDGGEHETEGGHED
jgi:hypothetical protein